MNTALLEVRDLSVTFDTELGRFAAVDGISFDVPSGTTVALVGESGCGKSVTAHALMRLLPGNTAVDGQLKLDGQAILELPERAMRKLRGDAIAIVFQDPMSALNPSYSIGSQLVEAFRIHRGGSRSAARKRAVELLTSVGFPEPEQRFDHYPHELSGGMRQRVLIAMALSCEPKLLIADEPTTALDMVAAAQVTTLLGELQRQSEMSLLLISHDVAMVGQIADRVVVMYAGQVVEQGPAERVLGAPAHPYTRALLESIPPTRTRRRRRRKTPTRLPTIEGSVPEPLERLDGCRFAARCPRVMPHCSETMPSMMRVGDDHHASCFLHEPSEAPNGGTDETTTAPSEDRTPISQ